MDTVPTSDEQLRTEVQKRYAKTALQVLGAEQVSGGDACCEPTCCTPGAGGDTQTKTLTQLVPAEQSQTSACCGPSWCGTGNESLVTAGLSVRSWRKDTMYHITAGSYRSLSSSMKRES
jgi:hypothetical protein